MTFARYISNRFFAYVAFASISLTLIFNLIEFFEKMVRVNQTVDAIFNFILLNILPSFFENLPVAAWLAMCMLLREMQQQNEWEIAELLNIPSKKIFATIFMCTSFLAFLNFSGKEIFTRKISQKAEQFKQEKFKQNKNKKLFNQWFLLSENEFCHFQYLDLETEQGRELSIFKVSPRFKIEKIRYAEIFRTKPKTNELFIESGSEIKTLKRKREEIIEKNIFMPCFFTQLHMKGRGPKFLHLINLVIFERKILPENVYNNLLYTFLNRILVHLLLILYPLLTLAIFFFFRHVGRYYRWILIFSPYPIFVVLSTITDTLMQMFCNGIFAFLPYVTMFSLLTIIYFLIQKKA
jgi:lipopolysaccharide export LptBFGC system permease protein LptF